MWNTMTYFGPIEDRASIDITWIEKSIHPTESLDPIANSPAVLGSLEPQALRDELLRQYVSICGERAHYEDNVRAGRRFIGSMRAFFNGLASTPEDIVKAYAEILNGGRNCPDGSPAKIQLSLIDSYGILKGNLQHLADALGDAEMQRKTVLLKASLQSGRIVEALKRSITGKGQTHNNEAFISLDQLRVLQDLALMSHDSETQMLAGRLLNTIEWDEKGRPVYPSEDYFGGLVLLAKDFVLSRKDDIPHAFFYERIIKQWLSDVLEMHERMKGDQETPVGDQALLERIRFRINELDLNLLDSILYIINGGKDNLALQMLKCLEHFMFNLPAGANVFIHIAAWFAASGQLKGVRLALIEDVMADVEAVSFSVVGNDVNPKETLLFEHFKVLVDALLNPAEDKWLDESMSAGDYLRGLARRSGGTSGTGGAPSLPPRFSPPFPFSHGGGPKASASPPADFGDSAKTSGGASFITGFVDSNETRQYDFSTNYAAFSMPPHITDTLGLGANLYSQSIVTTHVVQGTMGMISPTTPLVFR